MHAYDKEELKASLKRHMLKKEDELKALKIGRFKEEEGGKRS